MKNLRLQQVEREVGQVGILHCLMGLGGRIYRPRKYKGREKTAGKETDSLPSLAQAGGKGGHCHGDVYSSEDREYHQVCGNLLLFENIFRLLVVIPFSVQLEEQMSQHAARHDSEGYTLADIRDQKVCSLICCCLWAVICHGGVFLF